MSHMIIMPWGQLSFSCISVTSLTPLNGCNEYQYLSRQNTRSPNLRSVCPRRRGETRQAPWLVEAEEVLCVPSACSAAAACFCQASVVGSVLRCGLVVPLPDWLIPSCPPCLPSVSTFFVDIFLVLKCREFCVTWEYICDIWTTERRVIWFYEKLPN